MNLFMKAALKEAEKGLAAGDGGPFGAVIVKDGEIVSRAHNEVIATQDPTAHAEVLAIRRASRSLGRFDLSDCIIYTSCEPCPMCFSAIHWAKMRNCVYGCTREDAAGIGFDDAFIYDVLQGKAVIKQLDLKQTDREDCLSVFKKWQEKEDKTAY